MRARSCFDQLCAHLDVALVLNWKSNSSTCGCCLEALNKLKGVC